MTKEETIKVLQSIEDRAADFPYMTACDWVAIAAAKRHLKNSIEAKESEDEKIRKWLIAQLKIKIGNNAVLNNMIYKAIDWLEKQGEKGTNGNDREIPNSAWSEEDEKLLGLSISNLTELKDRFGKEYGRTGDCIEWLKSLKDRVQPQPKQEWSKEDEYILDETIQHLEELIRIDKVKYCGVDAQYYQRDIDWLKSLRPQNKYAYNPYKAIVESIAAMVEKYAPFDSNLQDFYDNVKVKCKDAKEYDSLYPH